MAYSGPRPIFPILDGDDNINSYTGEVEKYSNWSIFNPVHLLQDAPLEDHTPGEGRHPHDLHMSRVFQGLEDDEQPLREAGDGPRLSGFRYGPYLNRAAGNNLVFKASYGHAPGTPIAPSGQIYWYSNFVFGGLTQEQPLKDPGHAPRLIGATGTASTFGRFIPEDPDPTRTDPLTGTDYGQTVPTTNTVEDNPYGRNRVNEWFGVPSSKAL